LHLITLTHTHSVGTPLYEGFSPSQRPLPDNTQHWQQTNIPAPGEIRARSPSKRSGP